MKRFARLAAAAGLTALIFSAAPALAHHSFAMFDSAKDVTLTGAVKEMQWTNPHIWIQFLVKDPATGKEVEWSIEGNSPNGLARLGWKRTSLNAGDKAVIVIHPLKDGGNGGSMVSVTVDGVRIGNQPG